MGKTDIIKGENKMTYVIVGLDIVFLALLMQIYSISKQLQQVKSAAILLETILRKQGKVINVDLKEYNEDVARGFKVDMIEDNSFRIKFL